ncbi:MAG TPA: prolyl oligopeptidase family serine peptidase [Terracidiphilus sp.]|nr:prolyl oligopeptidase family serine peptidase [Terracidiphilus sp.]
MPRPFFLARRAFSSPIPAIAIALLIFSRPATAQNAGFTIEQALSAPFASHLTAAPSGNRFAWVANMDGKRNIWIAEPAGSKFTSRQVTHYDADDGQELSAAEWTADAESIVFVRGAGAQGETHPVPNPAWFPNGAHEQLWIVSLKGGEPRLIGDGSSPAVAPDGKSVAYLVKGQVWIDRLDDEKAKPRQLLVTRGTAGHLRWSPDGKRLAFVTDRDDHSFIAVCAPADNSVTYLDPSTDLDSEPVWSPESTRIAFVRAPWEADSLLFVPHRTALPWSIRIADVTTGKGREIWRAIDGAGSAFRGTDSDDQLHWTAGNHIVFPWERDHWLRFYSVPADGGAPSLLTPGDNFEVEHVSLSRDRKSLVFDSNQNDVDRRHLWRITFAADGSTGAPQQLTSGDGIETQPVVASDGETVAMLRSDFHVPMRAAIVHDGSLTDLAPQAVPADFPGAKFITPQQVVFSASDGLQIHGQLFLPPDSTPGERRPAAIFFHGGSQRQMLLGWHYMEYYSNAYAMNQYLASKGFVVLSVNYRSGIGYGLDFREALNYGADGASEFHDVLGAGLYLRSRPDVDGAHIGCWGGSYGGYLTALALSRASDLFAAGVDMHGVHDWNLEMPTFVPTYDPQKQKAIARRAFESSPISSVSTWRSPVLLIHGDDDRNVPFAETVQLVEALRRQHVEFEELIFPDEIHDFLLRRSWVRAYSAGAEFLTRKLKANETR